MGNRFELTGRVALVTGGARGIGAAIARGMADAGARVVIGDVLEDAGRATAAEIGARFVRLDVSRDADWAGVVAGLSDGFDILVNNAGIEVTALIADTDADAMRAMFDVNLLGTMLGMKHAFRAMRPGGAPGRGGSVVNIASVAATIAFPAIAGYSATKSGVDRLTRVGAMEAGKLGYGVRVNCIYPGLIPTDMGVKLATDVVGLGLWPTVDAAIGDVIGQTPLGRMAEVGDIADAAVFLASDAARSVTGIGLPVDGGMGT